jgi:TetR/AcrR family transcriptional repressor of nem operon
MGRTSDAREKLLEVAFDLIWNNSYGGVSVDQICERASVNKGSFYHFFPSKADLTVAAYEAHWQRLRPELDRIFSPQTPPLERIEQYCRYFYEVQKEKFNKCGHVLGCPFASVGCELSNQDEKIRCKVQEMFDRNCKYLETAIADATREGLMRIENPRPLARALFGCVLGMLIQARVRNDPKVLLDLETAALRMIGFGNSQRELSVAF